VLGLTLLAATAAALTGAAPSSAVTTTQQPAAVMAIGPLTVSPYSGGVRVPVTFRCNGGYLGLKQWELVQIRITETTPSGTAHYYLGFNAPGNQAATDIPGGCTGGAQFYRFTAVRDDIYQGPSGSAYPWLNVPGPDDAYLAAGTATVTVNLSGSRLSHAAVVLDDAQRTATVRVNAA
jgi:hypothetical protein